MTPRRRAILIVGLAAALIAVLIAAAIMLSRATSAPATPPSEAEAPSDVLPPPAPTPAFENPLIPRAPVTDERTESRQVAELFAERYGSYSNQGDYRNLRDLLPVMTDRYRAETTAFLEGAGTTAGQPYEGVTSRKVSTSVRESGAASAVVAVTLQQERTTSAGTSVGYRTLRMELRKIGDAWLVDRAAWED